MLRNLMELYKRSGDLEKLAAVVNQLLLITHTPQELFLRANIHRLHEGLSVFAPCMFTDMLLLLYLLLFVPTS